MNKSMNCYKIKNCRLSPKQSIIAENFNKQHFNSCNSVNGYHYEIKIIDADIHSAIFVKCLRCQEQLNLTAYN